MRESRVVAVGCLDDMQLSEAAGPEAERERGEYGIREGK